MNPIPTLRRLACVLAGLAAAALALTAAAPAALATLPLPPGDPAAPARAAAKLHAVAAAGLTGWQVTLIAAGAALLAAPLAVVLDRAGWLGRAGTAWRRMMVPSG